MKSAFTFAVIVCALFLAACGTGKGKVVAKVKGLKVCQGEIDSLFGTVRDKKEKAERVRNHLKEKLDQQVLYLQAIKAGFHKQPENKAILKNIDMIETANYYISEVLRKNWGFLEKDVARRYNRDKDLYKRPAPKADSVPTAQQKKDLAAWKADPWQTLETVRAKVLRSMLLETPDAKKSLDEFFKSVAKPDSFQIQQRQDEIINQHVTEIESTTYEALKKAHGVEIVAYAPQIPDDELKAEWEKTKANYKRQPDLTVQHIEVADRKIADKIVDQVNNKNADFLKLQKKHSANKQTLGQTFKIYANEGITGILGDSKSVYSRVTYVPAGKVCQPIGLRPDPTKEVFHIFKLVQKEPEALMSFEEAKSYVREGLYARKQLSIPDNTVLAKVDGRPILASEVFTLLYKMSPMVVNRYKTEEGRSSLLERYYLRFVIFSKEARRLGVHKEPALKDKIETSQKFFLVSDFTRSYLDAYLGIPEAQLKGYYKAHEDSFKQGGKLRTFDEAKTDVVNKLLVPDTLMQKYYDFNQEDYLDDKGVARPFSDVRSSIYYALLSKERKYRTDAAYASYRKAAGVKIYVKEWDYREAAEGPDALFEKAKKQHEERQYSEAVNNYNEIRYRWPAFKENPQIAMALAQIYVEQRNFNKAINEYRKYMRLYADSKDKYKAQFMIGFVYSENLNDTAKAISSYQAVLDNYPACDLVESAKFMIEHLKTGKEFLIPDDSTAVDTSVKM